VQYYLRIDAKAAAAAYVAARQDEAEAETQIIKEQEEAIENLLLSAVKSDPRIKLTRLYHRFEPHTFNEQDFLTVEPSFVNFEPQRPALLAPIFPEQKKRRAEAIADAEAKYQAATAQHNEILERRRLAFGFFQADESKRQNEVSAANTAIDEMISKFETGDHDAVVSYYKILIQQSLTEEWDAISADIGFSADSKQLVVDLELPPIEAVPEVISFKYVKSGDRIDSIARSPANRKALYSNLISQIALKCIDTVFRGAGSILSTQPRARKFAPASYPSELQSTTTSTFASTRSIQKFA
jgi:restriction system protein